MVAKTFIPSAQFEPAIVAGALVKAMTTASAVGSKGEPFEVPLENIRVLEGFNVRVTGTPAAEAAMDELVQSIVANGFYHSKPLSGFVSKEGDDNLVYVKDGHRRLEAVTRANAIFAAMDPAVAPITALPVVASPAGSLEDMTVEMAQSNTGAPLTMFEKGLLAKRLLSYNMTKEEAAAKLSMTERHLNNVLLLADAPAKLRDLIVTEKVTPTTGLKLMKDPKTAVAKATAMVSASEAKGKAKATPKDVAGPKLKSEAITIQFTAGDSIKTVLQTLAAKVREIVKVDGDDNILTALGEVFVAIRTPAPVAEPKPAPAPKPAKVAKPAKAAPAPKPAKAATPKKSPAAAKEAAKAHLGTAPAPRLQRSLTGLLSRVTGLLRQQTPTSAACNIR